MGKNNKKEVFVMRKKVVIAVSLMLFFSLQARAADKGAIELMSIAEVEITVKNDNGEKEVKRVEASKANVAPGDTVIFTNYFINIGQKPADKVVLTNPVPEHMIYVDGTAEGKDAKIEFSVDKGKSYNAPGKLIIKKADGKERPATAADYSHIRWTLEKPVAPGGKGSVSFRAKVK